LFLTNEESERQCLFFKAYGFEKQGEKIETDVIGLRLEVNEKTGYWLKVKLDSPV
jgi:hypothetical protein